MDDRTGVAPGRARESADWQPRLSKTFQIYESLLPWNCFAQVAGQGPQRVVLSHEVTGKSAGVVTLTISGGSPAISGLPHTEGAHLCFA